MFNFFLLLSSAKFYLGAMWDAPVLLILFWDWFFYSVIGGVLFFSLIELLPILLGHKQILWVYQQKQANHTPKCAQISAILCYMQNTYLETIQPFFQLNTSFNQFPKSPEKERAFKQVLCILNCIRLFQTYGAIMALAGLFVDCTWESQPSSCAFSWGPVKRHGNIEAIKEPNTSHKFTNKAWKSGRFKSHLKHSKLDLNLKTNRKNHSPKIPNATTKSNPNPVRLKVTIGKFQPPGLGS